MTTPKATCQCGSERPAIGRCPNCGKRSAVLGCVKPTYADGVIVRVKRIDRALDGDCEDCTYLQDTLDRPQCVGCASFPAHAEQRCAELRDLLEKMKQERDAFENLYHSNRHCECSDDEACAFVQERDVAYQNARKAQLIAAESVVAQRRAEQERDAALARIKELEQERERYAGRRG